MGLPHLCPTHDNVASLGLRGCDVRVDLPSSPLFGDMLRLFRLFQLEDWSEMGRVGASVNTTAPIG